MKQPEFFTDNLDDLVTIKAIHKDCEISIFDMRRFEAFSKERVEQEIFQSGIRWKKSIDTRSEREPIKKEPIEVKPQRVKPKKYWERRVMCVETSQVFNSIRECSEHTGIPYMTIVNCIKNGNATRGVHFANVAPDIDIKV